MGSRWREEQKGPAMRTYGQLIHVEEFCIDTARYKIAVFRVHGGLYGQWSCDGCTSSYDDKLHPSIEDCGTAIKALINEHHRQCHSH
jgi:hypothetical protein